MPARWIRVDPASALRDGFEAIRRETGVPDTFPADVQAEAAAAAARTAGLPRVDLPFVTIDPPGSRDLDQALHIERRGDGHRVSYAIADAAAFVAPGGAVDRESHERGVTAHPPDRRAPLHPPVPRAGPPSPPAGPQGAAAPAGPERGRGEPARGAVAAGRAVDARSRRSGRALSDRGPARGGPQRRPAHLRGRARRRRGAAARGR